MAISLECAQTSCEIPRFARNDKLRHRVLIPVLDSMKMQKKQNNSGGFSLIELLVVISIIAVLVAVGLPNYLSARQRTRDSRKKTELSQMKTALRLYFNDYGKYPDPQVPAVGRIDGCGDTGTAYCSANTFCVTSGGSCETTYMKRMPDPVTDYSWSYTSRAGGDDFCLWSSLDNLADPDIAASQSRCSGVCWDAGYAPTTDFMVCAD